MGDDLAFTGPSLLTPAQSDFVDHELAAIRRGHIGRRTIWRSGGAHGVDTRVVLGSGMTEDLQLIVPEGKPFNGDLVSNYVADHVVRVPGDYRDRNERLVRGATRLHAFVKPVLAADGSPRFYRSGEWMTVNIARFLGVPVTFHVLPAD